MISRDVDISFSADTGGYVTALTEAIAVTEQYSRTADSTLGRVTALGNKLSTGLLRRAGEATGADTVSTAQAAKYQQQLSGLGATAAAVGKDVDSTYDGLRKTALGLARDFPIGITAAIKQIQSLQQVGIPSQGPQMARLARGGVNLGGATGEDGASLIATQVQLARTFGNSTDQIDKLNDSLVTTTRTYGASASGALGFSKAIAPIAATVGLAQTDVIGLSTAFSRLGEDGFGAATAFNRVLIDLNKSLRYGSPAIQEYAGLIGTTSENLTDLMKTNPGEVLLQFSEAINRQGPDSIRALEGLGLDGLRTVRSITALSREGNLRNVVNTAANAYGDGSTARAAAEAYSGVNDKLTMLSETMSQTAANSGQAFLGVLEGTLGATQGIAGALESITGSDVAQKLQFVLRTVGGLGGTVAGAVGNLALLGGALALTRTLRSGVVAGFREGLGSPTATNAQIRANATGAGGAPLTAVGRGAAGVGGFLGQSGLAQYVREAGMALPGTFGRMALNTGTMFVNGFYGNPIRAAMNEPGVNTDSGNRLRDTLNREMFRVTGGPGGVRDFSQIGTAARESTLALGRFAAGLGEEGQSIRRATGSILGTLGAAGRFVAFGSAGSLRAMSGDVRAEAARTVMARTKLPETDSAYLPRAGVPDAYRGELDRLAQQVDANGNPVNPKSFARGGAVGAVRLGAKGIAGGFGALGSLVGGGPVLGAMIAGGAGLAYTSNFYGNQTKAVEQGVEAGRVNGYSQFNDFAAAAGIASKGVANFAVAVEDATRKILSKNMTKDQAYSLSPDEMTNAVLPGYKVAYNIDSVGTQERGDAKAIAARIRGQLGDNLSTEAIARVISDVYSTSKDAGLTKDVGAQLRALQGNQGASIDAVLSESGRLDSEYFRPSNAWYRLVTTGDDPNRKMMAEALSSMGTSVAFEASQIYGPKGGAFALDNFANDVYSRDVKSIPAENFNRPLGVGGFLKVGVNAGLDGTFDMSEYSTPDLGKELKESTFAYLSKTYGVEADLIKKAASESDVNTQLPDILSRAGVANDKVQELRDNLGLTKQSLKVKNTDLEAMSKSEKAYTAVTNAQGKLTDGLFEWVGVAAKSGKARKDLTNEEINSMSLLGGAVTKYLNKAEDPYKLRNAAKAESEDALRLSGGDTRQASARLATMLATASADMVPLLQQAIARTEGKQGVSEASMSATGQLAAAKKTYETLQAINPGDSATAGFTAQLDAAEAAFDQQKQAWQGIAKSVATTIRDLEVSTSRAMMNLARSIRIMNRDADLAKTRATEDYDLGRKNSQRDFGISQGYAKEDYYISRKRNQEAFDRADEVATKEHEIAKTQTIEDQQRQRRWTIADHNKQVKRMQEDAAKTLYDPYQRITATQVWDAGSLSQNLTQQADAMRKQIAEVKELKKLGVKQNVIDQLGLMDPKNAQQVTRMLADLKSSGSAGVGQLNAAGDARSAAAGAFATDSNNVNYKRSEEDYQLSLTRTDEMNDTSIRRSDAAFARSRANSLREFRISMTQFDDDFKKSTRRANAANTLMLSDMEIAFNKSLTRMQENTNTALGDMRESAGIAQTQAAQDAARMVTDLTTDVGKLLGVAVSGIGLLPKQMQSPLNDALGTIFTSLDTAFEGKLKGKIPGLNLTYQDLLGKLNPSDLAPPSDTGGGESGGGPRGKGNGKPTVPGTPGPGARISSFTPPPGGVMARGGITNGLTHFIAGEASANEAVIPLDPRGAMFFADAMSRYVLPDDALAARVASYATTASSYSSAHYDQSQKFTGPMTVVAQDPNAMARQLAVRQRRARVGALA